MSDSRPDDHFSRVAEHYAASRPGYPQALFDWLSGLCPEHDLAWDVGAGTGQATSALSCRFAQVLATDSSGVQLALAPVTGNVEYRVAPAHASGLPPECVDLVTVAQALHWFDLPSFYGEVRRVLKPAGVVAVWTYGVLSVEGEPVNDLVQHFYRHVTGPYWPAGRRHVENGYAELSFPFAPLPVGEFRMRESWSLDSFLGYVRSWSAVGRMKASGNDPMQELEALLAPLWGPRESRRVVTWPLGIRAGTL